MIRSKLGISFSIILTIAVLVASFFIQGIKSVYADDSPKILICIDPGHGGKDHGTTGPTGVMEKDVNLDIALRLRNKLVDAGFKVIMTRESDINHSLAEITDFANSSNADLFISIHNNSHPSAEMNGTQTFYFNQSPSGNLLATYINTGTIDQIGTVNRGVKSSNFKVLKNTKMVSALIEGVFMNNPNEEAQLKDENFRDKIATGIYNGIIEYLKVYDSDTVFNLTILNGIGIKGIAAKASELFKEIKYSSGKDKYNISMVADANSYNYKNTQIICKSKDPGIVKAAEEIRGLLKVGVIATQNGISQDSDIVIIIGKDYSPAAAEETYATTSSENPESILVNILNGQGIKGIAALARVKIETALGDDNNIIKIIETKNADNFNYKKTMIIIFNAKAGIDKVASDLKKLIGVGEISKSTGNADNVDITIILGSDYKK
jgi:N-acetylmuramoyl-L-alanine amidase CwlD